jgi:membrane-associated phospholipid phosphatase
VALSRVILGVHSPIDVTFGAAWGCLTGLLIVKLGIIDKYLKQKES